ncbi:MAG TPA: Wzz/FepE/Etk N-terminal domain-containing protein [Vicinamibacterales bacterium]|jgi:polysaccharide chain length determinant protein (PEP-CTERM system associated)
MLPGKSFTSEEIVRILKRRRWLILAPLALGLAAAPAIARRIPAVYRSETLIMVVPSRVPDSYVKSTVTQNVADRLPTITDQILSRTRLEKVINDFGLYAEMRRRAPMEDIVRQMRTDIGPVPIQPGAQSFRVSYGSRDPAVAQMVTARLASLFIDENSQDRENLAESTNVFLESQLEEAKARLLDHEKKLEEYRRLHTGELPSQLDSNLRAIQTAQLQLVSVSESGNRAQERRLLLERQLADTEAMPIAAVAPPMNGTPESQAALSTAQQLDIAERALDVLKLRYTADHPTVRKAERTVRELRDRAAEEARHPPVVKPLDPSQSPAEQARQRRIRDLQADMAVIDHQLSVGHAEETRLKDLIADYQRKVEAVPKRESELVEIQRDYDILKKTYDGLLEKREDSKLARNLERRQIGEQFRILDTASLPVRPSNQAKRIGISLSAAAVGLVLGLAVTVFLVIRDSSLGREEDVVRLLEIPVLALVPMITSDTESRRQRYRRVAVDIAGVAMLAGSAVFVVWGFLKS